MYAQGEYRHERHRLLRYYATAHIRKQRKAHELRLTEQAYGLGSDIFLIGDTPNDIICAKAIGARCLAVLAGSTYTKEQLAEHEPWKIIDKLPDEPRKLVQLFNEA